MSTTTYNGKAFAAAHHKFLTDATALSDDDIAQLSIIDRDLAERAHLRRIGRAEEERGNLKMPREQQTKAVTWRALHLVMDDCVMPLLQVQRYKCQQLEAKVLELSKELEGARSEIGYLQWARQQEAVK